MAVVNTSDAVREHYAALAREYDRKANRACKRAYRRLIERCLAGAARVLELGAGASDLLGAADTPLRVAGDFSLPMLLARPEAPHEARVAMDALQLPFPSAGFDAICCINLAEHVPDPARLFAEIARVLAPGGRCLAVTPNGDLERLLDLLERLHLKLAEGPHRFLTFEALIRAAGPLEIIEHRRFLAFPAGPEWLVRTIDRVAGRYGLFQYILLRKPAA